MAQANKNDGKNLGTWGFLSSFANEILGMKSVH